MGGGWESGHDHHDQKPETDRPRHEAEIGAWQAVPSPRFIQLQAWHDQLLGLTDRGEIYRLQIFPEGPAGYRISVDAVPLFGGFPRQWR